MICPKCGSDNVNVQVVSETKLKIKRHGLIYWLLIGWWLNLILWIFWTIPMLIFTLFRPRRYTMKTKHQSVWVCQSCGKHWYV